MPVTPNPTPEAAVDETARQLRVALATEGQMGTATITYVWPVITAALEQARHDGRAQAVAALVAAREEMLLDGYDASADHFADAIRVARGDTP